MKRFAKLFFVLGLVCATLSADEAGWEKFMDHEGPAAALPILVNRSVTKKHRFQIVGPLIGFADRQDLYSHLVLSGAVRYFFAEDHAWEMLRVHYDSAGLSSVAQDVTARTNYVVDARQARWSLTTGYIFSPIYGKYSLSEKLLVHFEGYVGASFGARFADGGWQFTGEPVIGMQHYLSSNLALILPEARWRLYSENRTRGNEFVSELVVQAGVSWLF